MNPLLKALGVLAVAQAVSSGSSGYGSPGGSGVGGGPGGGLSSEGLGGAHGGGFAAAGHAGGGHQGGSHVGGGSVVRAVLVGSGILPNSLVDPAVAVGSSAGFGAAADYSDFAGADYDAFGLVDYDAFGLADYDAFGLADYDVDFGGVGFDGAATAYDAGEGHGASGLHEIGIAEGVSFDAGLDVAAAFQDVQGGGFGAAGFANGGQISGSYGK
ncbi:spidroin-1-like [Penaeus vannamei]|uniref:spidroin-1-like n=1 Tax=Penaeus vannamei TaxID=6689 RepID=UPI00387F3ECC